MADPPEQGPFLRMVAGLPLASYVVVTGVLAVGGGALVAEATATHVQPARTVAGVLTAAAVTVAGGWCAEPVLTFLRNHGYRGHGE